MTSALRSREGRWLKRFKDHLPAAGPVLDLGCGPGFEAADLGTRGLRVVGVDRSAAALRGARETAPGAAFVLADAACPLPFRREVFACVVASLSLHYLPWDGTLAAFDEVHRVLRRGAPLIVRVNATDDYDHGSGQDVEVEANYFLATEPGHAAHKRFFDEEAVRSAVGRRFTIASLEHRTINRYEHPKRIWECLAFAN